MNDQFNFGETPIMLIRERFAAVQDDPEMRLTRDVLGFVPLSDDRGKFVAAFRDFEDLITTVDALWSYALVYDGPDHDPTCDAFKFRCRILSALDIPEAP